ncbi:PE family protein [Mycobacterium haemophilum]|uniref:PE domain-containing protein n=1 Tax=Mycobacterium haemophilum TaxID=29311 RepID=A0A0I9UI95_9MYCO|nr:PE family protein [Mycobacterium haemophilum]KLO32193.1 hypothetical protein ABH39_07610 [Mycobacterium haemophilum]KLO36600.1 hypothetical protein ABH38_11525 [Mycobacterium haemophilum]KLO42526.1 hypothetical protein ABH37_10150 [Mycobacterium haemophilum]KLO55403.1 hypothetical protein ABH36_07130 [Mycobacterium haemophilum]
MSFVTTEPGVLTTAAATIRNIVNDLVKKTDAAADPTIHLQPPATDEVSIMAMERFSAHAAAYQAVIAEASLVCGEFIGALKNGAADYSDAEAHNAETTA